MAEKPPSKDKDKSKVHKLSLKGSSKLVAEFVRLVDALLCSTLFRLVAARMYILTYCSVVPILNPYHPVRSRRPEKTQPWTDELTDPKLSAWRIPCRGLHSVRHILSMFLSPSYKS